MKRILSILFILGILLFIFSCQTTDSAAAPQNGGEDAYDAAGEDGPEKTPQASEPPKNNDPEKRVLEEMQAYLENAQNKMDEMAISEAINQYVAVLALRNSSAKKTPAILDLAKKAETELTKIEAGLLLQPGAEWLDENSNQVTASSLNIGKQTAQNPKVLVWYNVGGSRIALSAVPVFFEFVKGSGLITGFTTSNEYGEASVPVAKIDNPNKESVVRATVVYTVKGFTYRFSQTKLEFVYVPPSKRATILVYERGPNYVADDPVIFSSVYEKLKNMEFDFIPYNGKLLGADFMNVFGGDLSSIKKLTLEQNVPYLVVVLNDCFRIGKITEGIYIGEGRATVRIIRIADGKILFEAVGTVLKSDNTHGQGGTEEKAMRNVFTRTTAALEKALEAKVAEINKALGIE